jgi:2',3'-cyclic-nucleotide 2'-phosphodiesterase (5'-nucleotidase family)
MTIINALKYSAQMFGQYNLLQTANIRYAVASTSASSSAVLTDVLVLDKATQQWLPLDYAAKYTVATTNYLAQGGDGYSMLQARGQHL